MAEALLNTSGDSSDKMIAPRVSTWITFADGKEGVFEDIQTRGLQQLSPESFRYMNWKSKHRWQYYCNHAILVLSLLTGNTVQCDILLGHCQLRSRSRLAKPSSTSDLASANFSCENEKPYLYTYYFTL